MILNYDKIYSSKDEIINLKRDNAFEVVGLVIHSICNYDPKNENICFDMIQELMGEFQPMSNLFKQQIKDRMLQNNKYKFIGKSYFNGSNPNNDYTPSIPLSIEVKENPYSYDNEGYVKLFVKSGGADSERPIVVRKTKDGNYMLWSDTIMGLLSDIRQPESNNPWA